jgi:hypothetical protein
MPRRDLNEEVIELYSEVTHSMLPLVEAWTGLKETPTRLVLDRHDRVGQAFIYQPQNILMLVVNSDWYSQDHEWMGHLIRAIVLENGADWRGRAGEAWIAECLSSGEMWLVDTGT